ncbi:MULTISPECIES: nucleotidyltransferase family protein [unclassified Sphingobacterium]|uniref:nucleotidyltransferase domain-containing protein n=1 Tax=unclassified Sphingobacterium TaxID=2609468 RepID=UPI0025D3F126|nr:MULTISPECIES: nucleotidyltransferase family protein [unclassified Sphingobacterium]
MIKDRVTNAFFTLLRSGLWNTSIDQDTSFPLSDQEWEVLYTMSVNQTVEGIVLDALQHLDAAFHPPKTILLRWVVRVEKAAQHNKMMNAAVSEQFALFEKSDIEVVLLKGQGLSTLYENPDSRISGDIDWYFPNQNDYIRANQLIADMEIVISQTAGYSACYLWKGVEIDHHQHIFDIHNPFCKSYLKKLEKSEFRNSIHVRMDDRIWLMPAPVLNILQVNTHILKHQLSFGIGIRQLCDAARIYYVHHHYLDGTYLKKIYSKVGIIKWIYLLHDILHRYIGLPQDFLPFDTKLKRSADWMMQDILQSGNFGFHDSRYQPDSSTSATRTDTRKQVTGNLIKYVGYAPMEAIFFPLVQLYSGWRAKK